MRPDEHPEIRQLSLFKNIAETSFAYLMRGAYLQTFPPKVDLILEGENCDFLYIVVEGGVELFSSWNGRSTTMSVVRPLSTFILAAAVKDAACLMSARTLKKTRLILLPAVDVRRVLETDVAFSHAVITELAECYRGLVTNTKNIKMRSSFERLAHYLLRRLAESNSECIVTLEIEKRQLASYLGMTPENLSRSIKKLEAHGVKTNGTQFEITDVDDLRKLVKPGHVIGEFKSSAQG
ncbi:MAG: helix-turn-helix domain-containing protein [Rhodobacteraceae bacterium]|nr:helix-turn-helix domain-containing protein [Paracoccaceae bacterium]